MVLLLYYILNEAQTTLSIGYLKIYHSDWLLLFKVYVLTLPNKIHNRYFCARPKTDKKYCFF